MTRESVNRNTPSRVHVTTGCKQPDPPRSKKKGHQ